MKKKCAVFMSATLLVLVSYSALFAKDSMTIAVHDYAPYYSKDGKGMLIDVYKAVCDAAGIDVTFKVLPIKRGLEYLFTDQIDAFSPGTIFMSPDQAKTVEAINTFNILGIWLYYDPEGANDLDYKSLEDVKGKKVAVILNSPSLPEYKKYQLDFKQIQTPELLVRMLRAGRFEYVEATILTGRHLLNEFYKNEKKDFDFFIKSRYVCSIAFHKSNASAMAIMPKFKKGYETIKANGEYIRILEKYWGKGNIQKEALPDDMIQFGVEKAVMGK